MKRLLFLSIQSWLNNILGKVVAIYKIYLCYYRMSIIYSIIEWNSMKMNQFTQFDTILYDFRIECWRSNWQSSPGSGVVHVSFRATKSLTWWTPTIIIIIIVIMMIIIINIIWLPSMIDDCKRCSIQSFANFPWFFLSILSHFFTVYVGSLYSRVSFLNFPLIMLWLLYLRAPLPPS